MLSLGTEDALQKERTAHLVSEFVCDGVKRDRETRPIARIRAETLNLRHEPNG